MPVSKQVTAIVALATVLGVGVTAWCGATAREIAPQAEACLARPTVTCAVELALTVSADSVDDHSRAQLLVNTAYRLQDIGARKAYLDEAVPRFFSAFSSAGNYLDRERRVIDIAAAIIAGDEAGTNRLLGELQHFQQRWETLGDVIDVLAEIGRPDLAVALEARYRSTETVDLTDALGRDLGQRVLSTQQLLASSLVRCDCGPDPLPMVLGLPRQADRLDNAPLLYARRHDIDGLVSFLTREFGNLAEIEDERQREQVGYGIGLMLRNAPVGDIPAILRNAPPWLTALHFQSSGGTNIYGDGLARAIDAGDRAAVAALVGLRAGDGIVWLSGMTLGSPGGAANVSDLLPEPERDHLWLLTTQYKLGHGDPGRELAEAMQSPGADAWRKPGLYDGMFDDERFKFEFFVLEPLLARGAFDVAEEALHHLQNEGWRDALLAYIAVVREEGATRSAAEMLADHWNTYRQAEAPSEAGRSFFFAVRDLVSSHPDALPLE